MTELSALLVSYWSLNPSDLETKPQEWPLQMKRLMLEQGETVLLYTWPEVTLKSRRDPSQEANSARPQSWISRLEQTVITHSFCLSSSGWCFIKADPT